MNWCGECNSRQIKLSKTWWFSAQWYVYPSCATNTTSRFEGVLKQKFWKSDRRKPSGTCQASTSQRPLSRTSSINSSPSLKIHIRKGKTPWVSNSLVSQLHVWKVHRDWANESTGERNLMNQMKPWRVQWVRLSVSSTPANIKLAVKPFQQTSSIKW